MIQHHKLTSYVLVLMLLASTCAEAQSSDSTRVRLRYRNNTYYELGAATAHVDYSGREQFAIGLVTGIALPITTALSAEAGGPVAVVTGVAGFSLTLWGGKKLANFIKKPTPDKYMADLSDTEQRLFRSGYETTIDEKRFAGFTGGTLLGVAIDVGIVLYILNSIARSFASYS